MDTLINIKKQKRRIPIRCVSVVLIMLIIAAMFAGCGFAGAQKVDRDWDASVAEGLYKSRNKNLILIEWNDRLTTCSTTTNKIFCEPKTSYTKLDGCDNFTSRLVMTEEFKKQLQYTCNGHGTNATVTYNGEPQNGLWTVPLHARVDYGINSRNGITFLRDIAVMMYDSLFDTNRRLEDKFCKSDSGAWGGLNLDPIEVVSSINNQTISVIKKNAEGKDSAFQDIIQGAQTLAAGILISIWSISFISQIVNEKFTMDTFLKTTMQLLCGIVIVKNSDTFVWAFLEAGQALVNSVAAENVGRFDELAMQMGEWLDSGIVSINFGIDLLGLVVFGLFTAWIDFMPLVVILFLAVPFYALLRCVYQIASQMIMRIFELTARITLAPIPLAFSAQNGFSQETIRYFRGMMSCALQPLLIIVGVRSLPVVDELVKGALGSGNSLTGNSVLVNIVSMTLVYFVLGAYIGETKNLAKEIIAH